MFNIKGHMRSCVPFIPLAIVAITLAIISITDGCFVEEHNISIYSSIGMIALWSIAAIAALVPLISRRIWKRPATFMLHMSLCTILIGALITHLCSTEQEVHLRTNDKTTTIKDSSTKLSLIEFRVETYPGTSTPMDFVSVIKIDNQEQPVELRMNKTINAGQYKIMQTSFDSDGEGVMLKCSSNRLGTIITYAGYLMTILSFIAYFFEKHSMFRNSLRQLKRIATITAFALVATLSAEAATDLPDSLQNKFMRLMVMHNGRITPLETLAVDFTSTVTGGKVGADGMDAAKIMRKFIFDFGDMKSKKIIRVKNKELKSILNITGKYASYEEYMKAITSEALDIEDNNTASKFQEDIARFEAINMLVSGELLKMFPVKNERSIEWYSPVNVPSHGIESEQWIFIRKSLGYLNESIVMGDTLGMSSIINGIYNYQKTTSGISIPTWRVALEKYYSRNAQAIPLLVIFIFIGLSLFVATIREKQISQRIWLVAILLSSLCFIWLTILIIARWILGEHVPLSNGFETMQFMAWILTLCALLSSGKKGILAPASLFSAGLCLGVAAMSGSAKSIGNLVPVLQSPLLSIHVVLVMIAYALFMLLALNGIGAIISNDKIRSERMMWIGHIMLYPAVMLLAGGIFVGAIWADVSWGTFWSWDPKETWALITMLAYSFPLHPSLKLFTRPRIFHIYMIAAFFSVLITYFGVNFWLGGMHSYA